MARERFVWPTIVGVLLALVLALWRGFFWQHAVISGLAAAALVYSAIRTAERMRGR